MPPENNGRYTGRAENRNHPRNRFIPARRYILFFSFEISLSCEFENPGRAGNTGVDGAAPGANKEMPVTMISWKDCIVWCNALSEKQGSTPVYYIDEAFSTPLRTNDPEAVLETIPDYPYVNWDANGYRLPTEAEWDIAARGGKIAEEAGMSDLPMAGTGRVESYFNIGWNVFNSADENGQNVAHDVALKQGNELGLFDMNGNLQECCWDWYDQLSNYPHGTVDPRGPSASGAGSNSKLTHGGNYSYCMSPFKGDEERMNFPSDAASDKAGFRVVRIASE